MEMHSFETFPAPRPKRLRKEAANAGAEMLDAHDLEEITEGEAEAIEKRNIDAQTTRQAAKERADAVAARLSGGDRLWGAETDRSGAKRSQLSQTERATLDAFHDERLVQASKEAGGLSGGETPRSKPTGLKPGILDRLKRWFK